MNKKLKYADYMFIGTMLFGLFFGAGNLIFPLYLGQQAGTQVWFAISTFLVSGIGLPFLGVLAMGYANANDVQQLASKIHPIYGVIFTLVLYLTVGPFFALPRTGTVSFEIGIASYISQDKQTLALALYSVFYFVCALYFSLNPAKIVMWVGKILTPIFLVFIVIIVCLAILNPMGLLNPPLDVYVEQSLSQGFLEGYNTMDVLASFAFGLIVVNSVKKYGISEPKEIVKVTAKAGLFGMILMAVIYVAIAFVGASSVDSIGQQGNGGLILAQVCYYYLGTYVGPFLAIMIFLACITTAIGLISACASCFNHFMPKISYRTFAILVSILAGFIANIGLNNIINFAIPILMLICPLTISLMLLLFLSRSFHYERVVFAITTVFTFSASLFDALASTVSIFKIYSPPKTLETMLTIYHHLPFSSSGLGWVIPMFVGLTIGIVTDKILWSRASKAVSNTS